MYKILLILLLPISLISQTIGCDIRIIEDNRVVNDTLTTVEIINITNNISFHTKVNALTIYLNSPCDYMLTFNKPGYLTKQVFVVTNNFNISSEYILDMNVEMTPGDESVVMTGLAWFDATASCFKYKQSGSFSRNPGNH